MFNLKFWRTRGKPAVLILPGFSAVLLDKGVLSADIGSSANKYKNAILAETHHCARGRPWALGRDYFGFLVGKNLIKKSDHVLELGCGEGRLGIWLINYLKRDRYFGQDENNSSLGVFLDYEIPLHDLSRKEPNIVYGRISQVGEIPKKINVILDLFATQKVKPDERLNIYKAMCSLLPLKGSIVTACKPIISEADIYSLGLDVEFLGAVKCEFLGKFDYIKSTNEWYRMVKVRC